MIFIKRKNENLITTKDGLTRFSIEYLIMLAPALVAAGYLNGMGAVWRAAVSCAAAVLCEAAGRRLFGMKGSLKDLSAVTTGLVIALLLPASCPLWLPALGSAFAIAVAKLPFGGARRTPFVPAAVGWCFLSVCFTDEVFTYPAVSAVTGTAEGFTAAQSLSQMLKLGKTVSMNRFGADVLLTGRVPGAMGTTCVLIFLGIAAYLLIRKPERLIPGAGFLGVCALSALLFPRVNSGRISSVVCELCAGSVIFTALLIINDPVTCPKKKLDSFIYGAAAGALCMLFSYYGSYGDSACFSVLVINAVRPAAEDVKQYFVHARTEKKEFKKKRAEKEFNAPAAEYSVSGIADGKATEVSVNTDSAQQTEDEDDPMYAPDQERLKKIEDMFFNEVVKPVRERHSGVTDKNTDVSGKSEESSAPSAGDTGVAVEESYTDTSGYISYADIVTDDDDDDGEPVDYRKYLEDYETEESADE